MVKKANARQVNTLIRNILAKACKTGKGNSSVPEVPANLAMKNPNKNSLSERVGHLASRMSSRDRITPSVMGELNTPYGSWRTSNRFM